MSKAPLVVLFILERKKEMNLKYYIKTVHNGNQFWFVDEVKHFENQKRILDTIEKKKYLDGKHAISNRVVENYNGKPYEQRAILLQYAKLIVNLETTYLLKTGDFYW